MPRIPTEAEVIAAWRREAADLAVLVLSAATKGMSCVQLAELLGTSPHSLHKFLDGDPRIEKSHRPIGNRYYCSYYRLITPNNVPVAPSPENR